NPDCAISRALLLVVCGQAELEPQRQRAIVGMNGIVLCQDVAALRVFGFLVVVGLLRCLNDFESDCLISTDPEAEVAVPVARLDVVLVFVGPVKRDLLSSIW